MAAAMLTQVSQILDLVIEIRQQALDSREEFDTDLAELNAACRPVQQPNLQLILELANGLAEGGLGDAKFPRGSAETASLNHLDEGTELPKVDIHKHYR
ncbi:hypothetical protein RSO67_17395 [Tardiphaga sp. 709]|nr:hypothetical protein [Tardiphaga sp. 709]WNV07316.1 hypothetical protein RSO67_17395 [Tardiphaga sp. 709]